MPGLSKRSLGTELTALVRRAPIDVIRIYWPGKKYNRSAMENATSLQCKLLREREKRRRRKNNGKQWKKQWEAMGEQWMQSEWAVHRSNGELCSPIQSEVSLLAFDSTISAAAQNKPNILLRSRMSLSALRFWPRRCAPMRRKALMVDGSPVPPEKNTGDLQGADVREMQEKSLKSQRKRRERRTGE